MIDQLLKMADGPLKEVLRNSGMSEGPGTADAIEETLASLLQNKASNGDLSAIKEMFSGSETQHDSPVVNNLAGDLSSGLMDKLGISKEQALSLAMTVLPLLMNFFNKKVDQAPGANNDIMNSVADALSGKGNSSGAADLLGGLLGGNSGGKGGMDLGGLMDLGKGLFK
ncbi:hypothetical protein [Algoriphagus vanfongensis]|uniref:hypothetical protein n=1 Tax=Algoriphagus vanfongensis TaxID=426371 RepID=UPI0004010944|nr:hypothetical protein [Algoriphagus vanfongensis]